jgi:hypothetical protein
VSNSIGFGIGKLMHLAILNPVPKKRKMINTIKSFQSLCFNSSRASIIKIHAETKRMPIMFHIHLIPL